MLAADAEAEEGLPHRLGNRMAHARLAHAGRPHKDEDRPLAVVLELADGQVLQNALLHVLKPVVVAVQYFLGLLQAVTFHRPVVPRQGADQLQVVPAGHIVGVVGVGQVELLKLPLQGLLNLAGKVEGLYLGLELLVVARLGVGGYSQFLLYALELLAQEVVPLVLLHLVVYLGLNLLLDAEDFLLLLDVDENLIHPLADVQNLKHLLLLVLLDVQDGGDEIRDFARMVDVDHVQPHLLGKHGIVVAYLLHLADDGTGQGLYLEGVVLNVLQVLHGGNHGAGSVQGLADLEALNRRDKDVHPPVREVYLLYDAGHRADAVQVRYGGGVHVVLEHDDADVAVALKGFLDHLGIIVVVYHKGREDARKNRPSADRYYIQLARKLLPRGKAHNLVAVAVDFSAHSPNIQQKREKAKRKGYKGIIRQA